MARAERPHFAGKIQRTAAPASLGTVTVYSKALSAGLVATINGSVSL
jgi:hypothetical protein